MDTIFHKIIRKESPAKIEYEDEDCIVIHDIYPSAPVHLLVIPKIDLVNLNDIKSENIELIGKLLYRAKEMAKKFGIEDGYQIRINNGEKAGQIVFQLHVHVLGGWKN